MIKYSIDYQYMPVGAKRPLDDGEVLGIQATDAGGTALIPNVGDFVSIEHGDENDRSAFMGKVRSRLFSYVRLKEDTLCHVNIVVEETSDDWGQLIKE